MWASGASKRSFHLAERHAACRTAGTCSILLREPTSCSSHISFRKFPESLTLRLGDRQRDIGVHVTPSDFTPEQLSEVLARCKGLWQEKNLSRLAVPEMMEMDLPANLINPLHSYADIEKIIVENWPAREGMIKAEGADPERFKRILGLTWAHTKPRRTVRTVDIEEEHSRVAVEGNGEDADRSTVLENVRKSESACTRQRLRGMWMTSILPLLVVCAVYWSQVLIFIANVVIPAGCELIGMWGGEWDMQRESCTSQPGNCRSREARVDRHPTQARIWRLPTKAVLII